MRKPPENTSRRNTRRASHQVNIEQESRSGDESTDYGKHRDDNSYTTLQSTRDTSVTLSTTGKVHQAASGRSATALIFGPATGSRGEAEQFLGQLGPTCEYFLAEWENSLQSVDFLDFDPQGELVGAREPQFQSDYSFPAFPTPSSCLSWARSAVETSWTTTITLPPQLASADPCIDYAAPVPSSMAGMKRKADSDSSVVPTTSSSGSSAKRQSIAGKPESSKTAAMRGPATTQTALSPEETTHIDQTPREEDIPRPSEATSDLPNASRSRKIAEISARLNPVLPAGKVFPIRIGSDLFQLSGASISSDGLSSGSSCSIYN
jgi:hypothetical protein